MFTSNRSMHGTSHICRPLVAQPSPAVWRQLAVLTLGILSAALIGAIAGGCSHNGPAGGGPLHVPLSYTPEHARDSIKPYPGEVPAATIYVGQFTDERDNKDAIGHNTESRTPVRVVADSDPAEFVRATLAAQLKRAGLHVVNDSAQADRTISGRLLHFWVNESNNYEATISAAIRVTDKSGATRWEGSITGTGENFGSSLSPENYRQTLSDAMVRLTYENLLTDPAFQNALR